MHDIHEMQRALLVRLGDAGFIAPEGQALAHAPHFVQALDARGFSGIPLYSTKGEFPGTWILESWEKSVAAESLLHALFAKLVMIALSELSGLPFATECMIECSVIKAAAANTTNPQASAIVLISSRASSYARLPYVAMMIAGVPLPCMFLNVWAQAAGILPP